MFICGHNSFHQNKSLKIRGQLMENNETTPENPLDGVTDKIATIRIEGQEFELETALAADDKTRSRAKLKTENSSTQTSKRRSIKARRRKRL